MRNRVAKVQNQFRPFLSALSKTLNQVPLKHDLTKNEAGALRFSTKSYIFLIDDLYSENSLNHLIKFGFSSCTNLVLIIFQSFRPQ